MGMGTDGMNRVIEQLRAVLLRDGADLTDGQLLEYYLSRRDEAAFEALVRRHGPMVFGVCRRVLRHHHDSEDAFQATFLVLARKAASIVPPEMVGNWLYGVAYRTALKAKGAAAKRRLRERQVSEMPDAEAPQEDTWRDLQPLLDQELSRLQDKYRVPLILCGLEGKTEKEAARQLGWPQGTLSGRLSRARVMLAKRLARRGLVLSAGSLTGMLAHDATSACVPTALLVSTVKAAMLFAARQAAATGLVSAEVAALTQGVLTAMFLSKVKVAMTVLLAAAVFVSGTGLLMSRAGGDPDNPERKTQRNGRDLQERNLSLSASRPDEAVKATTNPADIWNAYQNNAALFDEMFNGKRITVTGKMIRITGSGPDTKPPVRVYYLEMNLEGLPIIPPPRLRFRFTSEDRKQLSKLKLGQNVTIEGEPRPVDQATFQFYNCKIVKPKADD
jgi:RNA polymerase sigma factor (sigma-70 family)